MATIEYEGKEYAEFGKEYQVRKAGSKDAWAVVPLDDVPNGALEALNAVREAKADPSKRARPRPPQVTRGGAVTRSAQQQLNLRGLLRRMLGRRN